MIILNCRVSKEQVSKAGSHGQTEGVFTCKISYRYELYWYEIFHRYHVNKYRAISKNRDELVPEWNLYQNETRTAIMLTPPESLIHLARAARSLVSANKSYIKVTKVLFFFSYGTCRCILAQITRHFHMRNCWTNEIGHYLAQWKFSYK